ncbi:MAG: arginine deiminase family protein [Eubacteriales bacterium]|nr:arginine deiminase family protein [Eubacteriales bacterium]MDD4445457.1 arginine deiminase family protein [Eubacteriales bacterium]
MENNQMFDYVAGERWFPMETTIEEDMLSCWGDWGCSSEYETLKAVLLRRPGKEIENFDWKAARFMAPVDPELFRAQHDALAQIYKDHGVRVYYVEEQRQDKPNAIFMRDQVFMTPEGAIVTRLAMSERRGEERWTAKALAGLGVPIVRTISGAGIFEGANAMWIDRKNVILSSGARANRAGVEQMMFEMKRMGVENILHMTIPYGHAHIDGLLNFASEDTAMIYAPQVPYDIVDFLKKTGFRILECPSMEESKLGAAVNFVAIESGTVVQCDNNPKSREVLEKNGIKVIPVDFSEVLKGWGAMHCCTAFLKRG